MIRGHCSKTILFELWFKVTGVADVFKHESRPVREMREVNRGRAACTPGFGERKEGRGGLRAGERGGVKDSYIFFFLFCLFTMYPVHLAIQREKHILVFVTLKSNVKVTSLCAVVDVWP